MSGVDCGIVKDLIPSYLDGICSESSKRAVEEHVQECGECRDCLERLKNAEIVAEEADRGGLDFLKRIKRYHVRKSVIGAGVFLILLFTVMLIRPEFQHVIEVDLQCWMLPVLMLGSWLLLSDYKMGPELTRGRIAAGAASGLGILYSVALGMILYTVLKTESGFWGIEMCNIGPFLNIQLTVIAIAELLLFFGFAAASVRKERSFGVLPVLSLGGCILSLAYNSLLFGMDETSEVMALLIRVSLWILLETAGAVIAGFLIHRRNTRKNAET